MVVIYRLPYKQPKSEDSRQTDIIGKTLIISLLFESFNSTFKASVSAGTNKVTTNASPVPSDYESQGAHIRPLVTDRCQQENFGKSSRINVFPALCSSIPVRTSSTATDSLHTSSLSVPHF